MRFYRRCFMFSKCCGVKGTRGGWKSVPLISMRNVLSTVPTEGKNIDDGSCFGPFE